MLFCRFYPFTDSDFLLFFWAGWGWGVGGKEAEGKTERERLIDQPDFLFTLKSYPA